MDYECDYQFPLYSLLYSLLYIPYIPIDYRLHYMLYIHCQQRDHLQMHQLGSYMIRGSLWKIPLVVGTPWRFPWKIPLENDGKFPWKRGQPLADSQLHLVPTWLLKALRGGARIMPEAPPVSANGTLGQLAACNDNEEPHIHQ